MAIGKISLRTILLSLFLFNAGLFLGFMLSSSRQLTIKQLVLHPSLGNGEDVLGAGKQGAHRLVHQSTAEVKRLQLRLNASYRVTEVACHQLLAGDKDEQAKAKKLMALRPTPLDYLPDERYAANDCRAIRTDFITESLSQEEADFPIAFSLVVFKEFYQVEKLFRAMYRPEHFYCFHVDKKSQEAFYQAVVKYASCFPNVAISKKRCDIQWGTFSVLEADLCCMEKLLSMSRNWRYFINLSGQEYPLRTMLELVRILKALNGSNNLENAGTHSGTPQLSVVLADGSKRPIQWYKGSVHVTVVRGFVEYAFSDVGKQITAHLRKHGSWPCPDETFFSTLNHNPKVLRVPGADVIGIKTDNVKQPFLNRYKNWLFGLFGYPCLSGKSVRQICIWGVNDLPAMNRRPEFFVNKFYYNFQQFALQCMIERYWNNTLADYGAQGVQNTYRIPLDFYTKFEFVRRHL